ncbi:adenosylcobinamide-GDP ribazoletransferase [Dyella sp.]|uniref:adenosylcobinamide-GDP ribazoletransferase n=1 Tax=Dyella sp. TaxID=1869338 RepID=UPI002ED29E2F
MKAFLAALGFLTRVPVPARVFDDVRATRESLVWYPAVGLVVSLVLWLVAWMVHAWPPLIGAALVLGAWVTVTGALHLDGLADSADAWVGGIGDRERTLAIMKDPCSGPAGVVALVLVLLLKFAALASAILVGNAALLLSPMLARAALTLAFLTTPYARANGLGSALQGASRTSCQIALALAAALAVLCGWRGLCGLLVAAMVFVIWRAACVHRLGGFTGDTCGALAELTEAAVLVAVLVAS